MDIINKINKIKEKIFPVRHTIVLKDKTKFKCRASLEAYITKNDEEKEILILDTKINHRRQIVTVSRENVNYIAENYSNEIWKEILFMVFGENDRSEMA